MKFFDNIKSRMIIAWYDFLGNPLKYIIVGLVCIIGLTVSHECNHPVIRPFGIAISAGAFLFLIFNVAFESLISGSGYIFPMASIHKYVVARIGVVPSKSRMKILTTFISILDRREENYSIAKKFLQKTKCAIEDKGVDVEILILDPVSYGMQQRIQDMQDSNEELKQNPSKISVLSLNALGHLKDSLKKNSQELKVKVFQEIPPFLMYQVENSLSMRFYPKGEIATKKGAEFYTFNRNTQARYFLSKKFEEIWNSQQSTCNLDEYRYFKFEENEFSFVDIYDLERGEFCEDRLIATNEALFEKYENGSFKITYRGVRHNARVITKSEALQFLERQEIKIVQRKKNKLVKIPIEDYLSRLWSLKYEDFFKDNSSFGGLRVFTYIRILNTSNLS